MPSNTYLSGNWEKENFVGKFIPIKSSICFAAIQTIYKRKKKKEKGKKNREEEKWLKDLVKSGNSIKVFPG